MPPILSVIIVNYNTADHLERCLPSLLAQQGPSFEILIVDNASQDESVAMIKSKFPMVTLITSPQNLGFAKANNLALKQAGGQYIYFLNPDTEVTNNTFAAMQSFMDSNPSIGMAGTAIYYPDKTPQSSVELRYPGQRYTRGELDGLPGRIAWLLGASLIVRSEVIKKIGGFSEDYFLYGEDIDLGLTVRKEGWELGFIPEAKIVHWEGQSERQSLPTEVWQKKFNAEMLFYQKHFSQPTIQAIKRANLLQARWRIATLTLTLPFRRDKTEANTKLAKYKLALQAYS
ncbi:MAG: glycosyltransferase family 2 protein [Desulfobulbaceae bacterium]|nr:glycosyltransferase family 2 protein [Desulfobulbaceae bacterium]